MSRVDDILDFLNDWRSGPDVREQFNLSNTEWYNMSKFLLKGRFVKRIAVNLGDNHTNRRWLYKRSDE